MSMDLWYEDNPSDVHYLQISHQGLAEFFKRTGKDFDAFRDKINDHHSMRPSNGSMFILERFYGTEVLDPVADYLIENGYPVDPDYATLEGESMVYGYAGVLVSWWW